jgi:hypothetical protein
MEYRTENLRDPTSQPPKGTLNNMFDGKDTSIWDIDDVDEPDSEETSDEGEARDGFVADLKPIPRLLELLNRVFPPLR